MEKDSKIYVAGHTGLVGSAIVRELENAGYHNLVLRTSKQLNLIEQESTWQFFKDECPEYVFLAAAKVGGILANSTYPVDFIFNNLQIQNNVINSANWYGAKKLLFLGSSCIYPKACPQPIKEEYLMTGPLEPTNEWYATAKIAGIKMCQAYREQYSFNTITAMPTNLYGRGDNFDLETSHVLPAMIRKIYEAKLRNDPGVVMWGSGTPRREFLHVDDLAKACCFLMDNYDNNEPINIGVGVDVEIRELAEMISEIVGYKGNIIWDSTKPDGTPRKLLDVSKINALGWTAKIDLREGIEQTYEWYRTQ